jgi:hypothetical protein
MLSDWWQEGTPHCQRASFFFVPVAGLERPHGDAAALAGFRLKPVVLHVVAELSPSFDVNQSNEKRMGSSYHSYPFDDPLV